MGAVFATRETVLTPLQVSVRVRNPCKFACAAEKILAWGDIPALRRPLGNRKS